MSWLAKLKLNVKNENTIVCRSCENMRGFAKVINKESAELAAHYGFTEPLDSKSFEKLQEVAKRDKVKVVWLT